MKAICSEKPLMSCGGVGIACPACQVPVPLLATAPALSLT